MPIITAEDFKYNATKVAARTDGDKEHIMYIGKFMHPNKNYIVWRYIVSFNNGGDIYPTGEKSKTKKYLVESLNDNLSLGDFKISDKII